MKLLQDGTIEGTPQEISEYKNINKAKVEFEEGSQPRKENHLTTFSTEELHMALIKRAGIKTFIVPQHQRSLLNHADGNKYEIDGPATILVNFD